MSSLALKSWFKRNNQSQSLVKAPSADLIVSDTGPRIPEQVEITCRMTEEEFKSYVGSVNCLRTIITPLVKEEGLRQTLRTLGYKRYPNEEIKKFLYQQAINLSDSKVFGKGRLGACYCQASNYTNFLPPRIINKVEKIKNHPYCPTHLYCWISDLAYIGERRGTEICFLALFHSDLYDQGVGEIALIIDAWRGPTFSDEEAKI